MRWPRDERTGYLVGALGLLGLSAAILCEAALALPFAMVLVAIGDEIRLRARRRRRKEDLLGYLYGARHSRRDRAASTVERRTDA